MSGAVSAGRMSGVPSRVRASRVSHMETSRDDATEMMDFIHWKNERFSSENEKNWVTIF